MTGSRLDQLILDRFPDASVDKTQSRGIGSGERAIPAFVRDWLISRYSLEGEPDRDRIQTFLAHHLPDKQQREVLRNRLVNGEELTILDAYGVRVDLAKGERLLKIPSLDVADGQIQGELLETNPLLLSGSLWGAGRLRYRITDDRGEVWMVGFQPMQTASVDLDYFVAQRQHFSVDEWIGLLVRSMGYEPEEYTESEQRWLLSRLALLIQPRLNLMELAPKGTGKSYVFSELSKYAWLISGGVVTRAQLFYNMSSKSPGVITRYDAVVLDEVQTIRLSDEGELLGALKGFLESGEFRVMGYAGNSEASFALLANIPIDEGGRPIGVSGSPGSYLNGLPSWLSGSGATALLDRFHGIIPGWEVPRIQARHLARGVGLRADFLGEVLHALRHREEHMSFVKDHTEADDDLRDIKAVQRLSAAFLRLLFPDLLVRQDEFERYCLQPAKEMRTLVRQQMRALDSEYKAELAPIRSRF